MSYPYRTTHRTAEGYIEDRGYPHPVLPGDPDFAELDAHFGTILAIGQTAIRSGEDDFDVVDGFPLLEDARARKLAALRAAWLEAEASGTVSLDGVAYDADERANRDIAGLVTAMEAAGAGAVTFCAADNSFHELSLADLRRLQLAVIQRAQALYARKWTLRTAMEQAATFEALDAVQISFEGI